MQSARKSIEKIGRLVFLTLITLLPLHTVLILKAGTLTNGVQEIIPGVWQYGTIQIFATDILIGILAILMGIEGVIRIRTSAVREAINEWKMNIWIDATVFFFILVAAVSVLWSPDKLNAAFHAAHLAEGIVIFLAPRVFRVSFFQIAASWASGAFVQSVVALRQFSAQEIFGNTWFGVAAHSAQTLGDSVVQTPLRRYLRPYGTFPHPNVLAAYLAVGVLACSHLIAICREKWKMIILVSAGLCMLAALFFTFSREMWIALIGASTISVLVMRVACGARAKKNFPTLSPLAFFILLSSFLIMTLSTMFWEPLSTRIGVGGLTRLEQKSVTERQQSLAQGISLMRSSWRGVGVGQYTNALARNADPSWKYAAYDFQPVHMMYMLVAAELGYAGLVLFLFLLFQIAKKVYRAFRTRSGEHAGVYGTLGAVFLLFMIGAAFDHLFWTLHAGVLMWWAVLGACAAIDREQCSR